MNDMTKAQITIRVDSNVITNVQGDAERRGLTLSEYYERGLRLLHRFRELQRELGTTPNYSLYKVLPGSSESTAKTGEQPSTTSGSRVSPHA